MGLLPVFCMFLYSIVIISKCSNEEPASLIDTESKSYYEHKIRKILLLLDPLVDQMRYDQINHEQKEKLLEQMIPLYSELNLLLKRYEQHFGVKHPAVIVEGNIVMANNGIESNHETCEKFKCFNDNNDLDEDVYLDQEYKILSGNSRAKRALPENIETGVFDENWMEHMKTVTYPNYKYLDACWFSDPASPIKDWFRLVVNPADPNDIKYHCRYCKHFGSNTNLNKPAVSNDYFKTEKWKNKIAINDHHMSAYHREAVKNYKKSRNEDAKQRKYNEMGVSNAMTHMLTVVYTEVQLNIGAMHHPDVVSMMKATGSNLGHCLNTVPSFTKMAEFISSEMHNALIRKLKEEQQPIAILLDGSNDRRDRHIIAVSIVTLSKNIPTPFFYRLINVSPAQDAHAMLDGLMTAFYDDDLNQHITSHLYAYGSDGAKVMISGTNSLDNLLREELGKPGLYSVWCQAHRMQLITTHGLRDNEIIGETIVVIERTINDIYSFYHGSPKKKSHLIATAANMRKKSPSIRYVHIIRWVDSEVRAIEGLLDSWDVIVKDLESIRQTTTVSAAARVKADKLIESLKNRDLLLKMHILCDILKEFSLHSKKLQEFEQSIIDVLPMRGKLNDFYRKAAEEPLALLTQTSKFLVESNCNNNPCRSMDRYLHDNRVTFRDITLDRDGNSGVPVSQFLSISLESLKQQTDVYFPSGQLLDFDIFDPLKLPNDPITARDFGLHSVSNLVVMFGIGNIDIVCAQWSNLLIHLINNPLACGHRSDMPHLFWASVLNNLGTERFNEIFKLIKIVLVIPSGTSTVERYFSSMNHIESPTRTQLTLDHLEDRMRITLNGPSDFRLMPFTKLAAKWSETHSTCDENWYLEGASAKADHRTLYEHIG